MKKLLIVLTALVLLLSNAALADAQIVNTISLERSAFLGDATNCYYTGVNGGYQVFDADGHALSAVYGNLTTKQEGLYYEFSGSGLNHLGLLDAKGQMIIEPAYGEITFIDADWAFGYVLELTSNDVGDFKDADNNQYMVMRTDVLYDGRVIGSLSRSEFNPSMRYGTAGKYVYVRTTSDAGYYIDRNFQITRVDQEFSSSEFSSVYKKGMFHNPTQQFAFTAGCTLTEADVTYCRWYDDSTDQVVDLQGNVIKSGVVYDSVRTYGDYFLIRHNGFYGVMDKEGNVIIEPTYKNLDYSYGLFPEDYQVALTEQGHLHFIDKQGNITAKAEYELSADTYKGFYYNAPFAVVNNMGKYLVFTATQGQLPTMYEEFQTPRTHHKLLIVKKDGLWGAIDVDGNTVIPFVHKYALEQSNDSTLVYGYGGENMVYKMSFADNAPAAADQSWTVAVQSGADMTDAPVLAEGAWECGCGTITNGKFCPECGAKKPEATPTPAPVDDGSWICSCGSVNTGKFCPECGTAKPVVEVEPQCAACGYKPEGAAPKFCPECGTKF